MAKQIDPPTALSAMRQRITYLEAEKAQLRAALNDLAEVVELFHANAHDDDESADLIIMEWDRLYALMLERAEEARVALAEGQDDP